MTVKVHIVYCGGWGYRAKAEKLIQQIKDATGGGDKINFSSEATPTKSGYLEVTVDGVLVHSKNGGDGYVDSDEKVNKIIEAVKKALAGA